MIDAWIETQKRCWEEVDKIYSIMGWIPFIKLRKLLMHLIYYRKIADAHMHFGYILGRRTALRCIAGWDETQIDSAETELLIIKDMFQKADKEKEKQWWYPIIKKIERKSRE